MSDPTLEAGLHGAKPKSRKRMYLYGGLALILLIVIGVGVGVAVSRLNSDDDSPSNTTQADMAEPGASATERGNDGGSVEPAEEEPLEGPGTDDDSSTLDDINDVEDLTGGVTDTADDPSAVVPDAEDTGGMMPDNSEVLDVLAPSSGLEAGPMGSPTAAEGPLSEALGVDTAPSMAPSLISVVDTPAQVPAPETALPILVPIQAPTPAPALAPDPVLIPAPAPVPLPVPAPAPAPAPTAFSFGPSNTWSTLQDVPLFMGEVSAGVLTLNNVDYLVIVGQHPRKDPNFERDDGVTMIYNIAEDIWIRGAKRPSVGDHHASEVIDNKMYLFGGLKLGQNDVQVGELVQGPQGVDISWKIDGTMPVPSGSASSAYIGGLVYVCGGVNFENTDTITDCAAYDPVTKEWDESIDDMPTGMGRNHAASCTDGTSFYILGGRDGKNDVGEGYPDTQIYTPGIGWSTGAPMPLGRGGTGKGVFHDGKCYVFGGEVWEEISPSTDIKVNAERTVYSVDIYDIASNTWSQGKDMIQGLHGMFPLKYGNVVFLTAGGTEAAYSQSTVHQAYNL